MVVVHLFIALLPGMAGAVWFTLLAKRPLSAYGLLLSCTGFYCGFVINEVLVQIAKSFSFALSGESLCGILLTLSICMVLISKLGGLRGLKADISSDTERLARSDPLLSVVPVYVAAVFALCTCFHLYLPSFGWDVLGSWSFHAIQIIQQGLEGGVITNYGDVQSHPTVATSLMGWGGWAMGGAMGGKLILWFAAAALLFATLTACGVVFGVGEISLLCAAVTVLSPLLENHIYIGGYSELWLTLLVSLSVSLLAIGLRFDSRHAIVMGTVCAVLCIFTRKTGFVYSAITLLVLMVVLLLPAISQRIRFLLMIAAIFATLTAAYVGFSIRLFDQVVAWSPDVATLKFAGRSLELELASPLSIMYSEVVSKIKNSSFSIAWAVFVILTINITLQARARRIGTEVWFVWFVVLINWLLLIIGQFISPEIANLGAPGSDTSLSRSALHIPAMVSILVCLCVSDIYRFPFRYGDKNDASANL